MSDNIMAAIFIAGFLVIIMLGFGLFLAGHMHSCKKFDKDVEANIAVHGKIVEIDVVQSYMDGWYQTVVHKLKYIKTGDKELTIYKIGGTSVMVNDNEINYVDKLTIKFEDGYVLDYYAVYLED